MGEAVLVERSPWEGLARPGRFGKAGGEPGVRIAAIGHAGLALVAARRGAASALLGAAGSLGIELPREPRWLRHDGTVWIWAGPDQWFVRDERGADALGATLEPLLAHAAVVDQSHGRAVLELAGPRVRDALGKGVEVDLHPRAFAPGCVALTTAAKIPTLLWQLDQAPTFALAVPRSYAGSTWHWLTAAAGEYGYEVRRADASA